MKLRISGVARTTAVVCVLGVLILAAEPGEAQRRLPANRTYLMTALVSNSDGSIGWRGDCWTFTDTRVSSYKGEEGDWFLTESRGSEDAVTLDLDYEFHGETARLDAKLRIERKGPRHSIGGAGRHRSSTGVSNFGFVGRLVSAAGCPIFLEEWIHRVQADPACLDEAVFGESADSPYVLPFQVGVRSLVDSTYCNGLNHRGSFSYDFRMPIGTELVAVTSGVVREFRDDLPDNAQVSGSQDSQGNTILIDHDDGTWSRYSHLSQGSVVVQAGETVTAGQLIALSGYSGNAHLPHLHFSVFEAGTTRSVPINFRNAEGRLDHRGGLMIGVTYEALPW